VIRLRLFHPGRYVWRLRRTHSGESLEETWISLRKNPPNWERLFSSALDLVWLPVTRKTDRLLLDGQHGFINWREGRWLTRIWVRIEGFSAAKRILISATLLKAARFWFSEEE
jgi:hypothetical protein